MTGVLAGLLAVAGAALGNRRVGTGDPDGPTPFAPSASVAAMGGATTVLAVQEVPRLLRTGGLLAGGLVLVGSGLLLVASARADGAR